MKTKKLFLIYNNPDDSIILWDKQEIICSWATDTPISEVLKDIEREHKEEEGVFRIYLVFSFDILKDLNQEEDKKMTKKEKIKLNKMFNDNVVDMALDHSDFSALAADHWKDYLQENYKDPAEWAEENLSPDEIKDIFKGEEIVGADFKKEDSK